MTKVTARFKDQRRIYEIALAVDFDSGSVAAAGQLKQMTFSHNAPQENQESPQENKEGKVCKDCGSKEGKGCKSCRDKKKKRSLRSTIKGAVGLAKSEMGVGTVDDSTLEHRRQLCILCDRQDLGVCGECGCYCAAKVKLKKERCPLGKWERGEIGDGN
tara:strand:+ start:443 stop:919 length:477 start_codon:yes stop_codon:yes gene_type:complete